MKSNIVCFIIFKADLGDRVDTWAVHIKSEQSFDFNKAINCRLLKFDYYYEYDLPRHLDPESGVLTPAFGDMLPGWYGVQGKVEVIALEKLLRDMVSKNFCGKSFVFELHEKLTSKTQLAT